MRKRKRRRQIIVPVASMGDIAFLLIIFFLIASRLAQDKKITQPQSLDAVELKESVISVLIDENGHYYVNGREMKTAKDVQAEVQEMLGRRNPLGLLSEDIDPGSGELWGNFPQTYSMVGLINSAMRLSIPWERAF